MSSFLQHERNIRALEKMGFDVSEAIEDGKVTMESWGYDELVYLMSDIVSALQDKGFRLKEINKLEKD